MSLLKIVLLYDDTKCPKPKPTLCLRLKGNLVITLLQCYNRHKMFRFDDDSFLLCDVRLHSGSTAVH